MNMTTTISKNTKRKSLFKRSDNNQKEMSKLKTSICDVPVKALCLIYNLGLFIITLILSGFTFAVMMYSSVMLTSLSIGLFGFDVNNVNIILIMAMLVIILFVVLTMFTAFKYIIGVYFKKIFMKHKMKYIRDENTGKLKIEK